MGDFNIHINDSGDWDAQILQDTLNAFNLKQHINIPTHNLGHTIDLIITSNDYMGPLIPGSYISDHRMITLNTNIPKPKPKTEIKSVCNLTDNKVQQFIDEFNNTPILNTSNLIDATNQLNSEILRTMDKIAPQQLKSITSRIKKPWYNNDLKHQRQIMKNRERKWLKYREQPHWKAYKRERNRFITMIKYKKRDHIHNQISSTTGNSKKLYQLITKLTGQNKSNPLPTSTSNEHLADEFANYFLKKSST